MLRKKLVEQPGVSAMQAVRMARGVDDDEIKMLAAEVVTETDPSEAQAITLGSGNGSAFLQRLIDKFLASPAVNSLWDKLIDKLVGIASDKLLGLLD
jgi:hypothetical protein